MLEGLMSVREANGVFLYLPYPLQGLGEGTLGSALQLPKFLLTAAGK